MTEKHYDLICLGGGSGGIATAKRAAHYGARVLIIESGRLGGTCVNVGCVPKKITWHAAQLAELSHLASDYGFIGKPNNQIDWQAFVKKRETFIRKLNGLYADSLTNLKIQVVIGRGQFIGDKTIQVDDQLYTADHIVIAVGGKPFVPNVAGAEHGMTSDDFFSMSNLPKSIAVVGGGYIAVEFAGVLAALGVKTDLIVRSERLLKFLDTEIAEHLSAQMTRNGINIRFNEEIIRLDRAENYTCYLKSGETLEKEAVLWAVGRDANIDEIGLASTSVVVKKNGKIAIDDQQNTDADNIYAIGDITEQPELTPAAIKSGRQLAERLFNNKPLAQADFTYVPTVIFSHPAIATIGVSEERAILKFGKENVVVYKSTFNPLLRSMTDNKVPTFMKLICLKSDDERVIGLHLIGDFADEILQGFAVAIQMGATKSDFDQTLAIHPTSGEEFVTMR